MTVLLGWLAALAVLQAAALAAVAVLSRRTSLVGPWRPQPPQQPLRVASVQVRPLHPPGRVIRGEVER